MNVEKLIIWILIALLLAFTGAGFLAGRHFCHCDACTAPGQNMTF